jgi:Winged helix-turn-helix DNA-binding
MNKNSGNQSDASPKTVASGWDFLTNHAHVLLCVAKDPGTRLRDIAAAVGITERGAHKILTELVDEGYVLRERHGRRNSYKVKPELPLRHPLVHDREVGDLLKVLMRPQRPRKAGGGTKSSVARAGVS